ncbi:MAG: hypothetical protein CMF59_05115 [Leptospiraceae bacterium]|nr:hypothetical protein [Leptospiraceae bacterium]
MDHIISEALRFAFLFSLVLSVYYLYLPQPTIATRMLSLLYLSAFVCLLYAFWNFNGKQFEVGLFNHLYVPFTFLIGPCIYFAFLDALSQEVRFHLRHLLLFLPAILTGLVLIVIYALAPEYFEYRQLDYLKGRPASFIDYLNTLGLILATILCILAGYRVREVFTWAALRKERSVRTMLTILLWAGGLTSFAMVSVSIGFLEGFFAVSALSAILLPLNFILKSRVPDLFADLELVIEEARDNPESEEYKISRLEGVDLKELQLDLDRLMRKERLFLDEDLTLKVLAQQANVKSYQLTEFLNTKLKMNFARYVNHFRVEEAIRILKQEPEASILSVAYQVGFNSKANFNLAFKSIKGMSPRQYLDSGDGPA